MAINSPGTSPVEETTICPQPVRYASLTLSSLLPNMKEGDDAVENELMELWGKPTDPSSTQEGRPLSSMSTSAGPTPSPEEKHLCFSQQSPDGHSNNFDDVGPGFLTPSVPHPGTPSTPVRTGKLPVSPCVGHSPQQSQSIYGSPYVRSDQTSMRGEDSPGPSTQARKVFVGGVPQDMVQDDLFRIFSELGSVKKAWLQKYRAATCNNPAPSVQHRGFGFVIFHESSDVDNILGQDYSRYINLNDGKRLEVKRAQPSNALNAGNLSGHPHSPQVQDRHRGGHWPTGRAPRSPASGPWSPWGSSNSSARCAPPSPQQMAGNSQMMAGVPLRPPAPSAQHQIPFPKYYMACSPDGWCMQPEQSQMLQNPPNCVAVGPWMANNMEKGMPNYGGGPNSFVRPDAYMVRAPTPMMGAPPCMQGYNNSSMGVHNSSMGVQNPSMGIHNSSMGIHNSSMGVQNSSMGAQNSSMGVQMAPPYNKDLGSVLRQAMPDHYDE